MKNFIFTISLFFCFVLSADAQNITINGGVYDKATSKPLIGATLEFDGKMIIQTGKDGLFSFKVNVDYKMHIVRVSMKNYITETFYVEANRDLIINFSIVENEYGLVYIQPIIIYDQLNRFSSVTYEKVDLPLIKKNNFGQDLPALLQNQLSVQSTSDAGNSVGYTGLRVRGSDATRINVCINDVPVNDAESQQVYWVDIPDVAAMSTNIELQRGVGTSSTGTSSFGANMQLKTDASSGENFKELSLSYGSFNTYRLSAAAQFQPIANNEKIKIKARVSHISSDGFIDRASSKLFSHYAQLTYKPRENFTLDLINFGGRERTYQAWYGVYQDVLESTPTYNVAGAYYDSTGTEKYYDNQVDQYLQNYSQAILKYKFTGNTLWKNTFFFTKGKGYFENYNEGRSLSYYQNDTTSTETDIIDRRWLNNNFYGWISNFFYYYKQHKFTLGGGLTNYEGQHYSTLVDLRNANTLASIENVNFAKNYFFNTALKNDQNIYFKADINPNDKLHLFTDLQVRNTNYSFLLLSTNTREQASYTFINPKVGASYKLSENGLFYLSYSIGNREPNRDDHINSSALSRPKAERLYDTELGFRYLKQNTSFDINFYHMRYKNQLVLNGKINDVGAYTRENVENSYRRGLEASVRFVPLNRIIAKLGTTLSQNKIEEYKHYVDNYLTGSQELTIYRNTNIAFTPQVMLYSQITFQKERYALIWDARYTSKQYLDNTTSESKTIKPFFVNDLLLNIELPLKTNYKLSLNAKLHNVLNERYENNGYTFSYIDTPDTETIYNAFYPQAGRHFSLGLVLQF